MVVERDTEGFFVATVPALPGCHTQARSLDQLMERVREAIELVLEVEGESADELDSWVFNAFALKREPTAIADWQATA